MNTTKKSKGVLAAAISAISLSAAFLAPAALAQGNIDADKDTSIEKFLGLWITKNKDVVVDVRLCKRTAASPTKTSLCAVTLWDEYLDKPVEERKYPIRCNKNFGQQDTFKDGVWTDGWAYDARRGEAFQSIVYMNKNGELMARGYIGQKTQGRNYIFERTTSVPSDCRKLPRNSPHLTWRK